MCHPQALVVLAFVMNTGCEEAAGSSVAVQVRGGFDTVDPHAWLIMGRFRASLSEVCPFRTEHYTKVPLDEFRRRIRVGSCANIST